MARVCEICQKRTVSGGSIARRGLPKKKGGVGLRTTGHTLRKFRPNIQRVRAQVDGEVKRVRVCTRCMKSGRVVKPLVPRASA
jgi:large subunit ribosomal protein L28